MKNKLLCLSIVLGLLSATSFAEFESDEREYKCVYDGKNCREEIPSETVDLFLDFSNINELYLDLELQTLSHWILRSGSVPMLQYVFIQIPQSFLDLAENRLSRIADILRNFFNERGEIFLTTNNRIVIRRI